MAGSSLGGIIADSAVLNVPRGQHMNPFQTVLNKQKADALSNQRKAKEDSDALTSLDDYVVVDKNFLPSTAKQAVELSRDFNNKAMQLIGTPNAKNKIHDLYTKDYSVQLQMLRGANQAKLDYINADQSGKFNTYPDLATKFQTSEDYNEINRLIAEKGDNTLLSDGDKQFAFTPKPKFQEGTLFNTQENDYLANDPRVRPLNNGYDEIINTRTLSPEVIANKRERLLNDPTFIDTQLHELPANVRNDPSFDPQKYVEAKADELLNGRLQRSTTTKYLQKQTGTGNGITIGFGGSGTGTNERFTVTEITPGVVQDATIVQTDVGDKVAAQLRVNKGYALKDLTATENSPQFWSADKAFDVNTGKLVEGFKKKGSLVAVNEESQLEDAKGNVLHKFKNPMAVIKVEEGTGDEKVTKVYTIPYNSVKGEIKGYTADKKGQNGWELPKAKAAEKSDGFQTFTIKGITYKIPDSDVPEFKKDNGL